VGVDRAARLLGVRRRAAGRGRGGTTRLWWLVGALLIGAAVACAVLAVIDAGPSSHGEPAGLADAASAIFGIATFGFCAYGAIVLVLSGRARRRALRAISTSAS
jgi:hypothetical protein